MKALTISTPRNPVEAAYQARVMDRAACLWADGYTCKSARDMFPDLHLWDLFLVTSPTGKHYVVDGTFGTCDCRHFEVNGYCKHYLAIAMEMEPFDRFDAEVALIAQSVIDALNPLIPGFA